MVDPVFCVVFGFLGTVFGLFLGIFAMWVEFREDFRKGVVQFGDEHYRAVRVKKTVIYEDAP